MQELVAQVKGNATLDAMSVFVGISASQVGRFLRGDTEPDFGKLFGCLEAIDRSPRLFFEMAFAACNYRPGEVLRYCREDGQDELDPFVHRASALARFLRPKAAKATPSPRREELLLFEDQRFDDPLGTKVRLEEQINALIDEASMGEDAPRELLGDIAAALSIWASIQRLRNFRDDAGTALESAFELAAASGEPFIRGLVHQKAAYLLMDLSATGRGILFLEEAQRCFELARAPHWKAKVFVDLGVLYNYGRQHEEALDWLELSLEMLPESSQRNRFSAYHNIAIACSALDRYSEAAAAMAQAWTLRPDYPLAEASLKWTQGSLHRAAGEIARALEAHYCALSIFRALENWMESAFVVLDLAKSLLRAGDKKGLAELSGEAMSLASKLRRNKSAANALREFALVCVRGSVAPPNLQHLEEGLKGAFPERLPHLDQN
jgi:tetratricopeptide (TPR) repeat protein